MRVPNNVLRFLLTLFLVSFFHIGFSQTYLEFKERNLHTLLEQKSYVDKEIAKQLNWTSRKVELLCLKSDLLNRIGDYEQSEHVLKSIPEIAAKKKPGVYALAQAKLNKYLTRYEESYTYFKEAQSIFRKKKQYGWLADAFVEEAELHRKIAQHKIGIDFIDSAENILMAHACDPWVRVKMLNRSAAIANEYEKTKESCIRLSLQTISLAKKEKAFYWLGVSYIEIGSAYYEIGKLDSALIYAKLGEVLFRKLGLYPDALYSKYNKAIYLKDIQEKIVCLEEIISEVQERNVKYPLGYVYNALKKSYSLVGDYKKALGAFEEENELWRISLLEDQEVELAKIADDFESEKLKSENEKIKLERDIKEELFDRQRHQFYLILAFSFCLLLLLIALFFNSIKRKKLYNELQVKSNQKDILIQEVHHRVKNNLQFVKSIILFQSTKKNQDDQTLKDVSRRIDAISLVHEMLYSKDQDHFNKISVKEYLEKLIQYSEELYNGDRTINTQLKIDKLFLPTNKLESIGIICSELLSNSVKYAFGEVEYPEFTIELTKVEENTYLLHTFDNGITMNNSVQTDGLGIKMIDIYSRQLKGVYTLDREAGYHYRLYFNIKEE